MPSIHRVTGVSYPRTITITLEVPMESISQHSGFMMMMMLNHRKRVLNESFAMAVLEFEGKLTNSLAIISRLSVRFGFD